MGSGTGLTDAGLSRSGAYRSRSQPGLPCGSEIAELRARGRFRPIQACRRAIGGSDAADARTREAEKGMTDAVVDPAERRCGFVALIGAPNVGKSTLTNALVGSKVSIVTPKVQTTRALIRGIAIVGVSQLIFVDTPGIFTPRRRLDRAMVGTAWGSAQDADIVALLIDSRKGVGEDDEAIVKSLADVRPQKVLVLNKVDIAEKPALLALTQTLNERMTFAATFMVSA